MQNTINGKAIVIEGQGTVSAKGLDLDLTLSEVPQHWSGGIVPCICSGPGPESTKDESDSRISSPGLMTISRRGYRTSPGTFRVASLFDELGNTIACVRACGVYARLDDKFDFSIQVETQTKPGSVIDQLVRVDSYAFLVRPNGPGKAEVTSQYTLSTKSGARAHGVTHIFYDFLDDSASLAAPLVGRNDITIDWKGTSLKYSTFQRTLPISSVGQFWP